MRQKCVEKCGRSDFQVRTLDSGQQSLTPI